MELGLETRSKCQCETTPGNNPSIRHRRFSLCDYCSENIHLNMQAKVTPRVTPKQDQIK